MRVKRCVLASASIFIACVAIASAWQQATSSPLAAPSNPPVEPGKVDWHTDFTADCKASCDWGKPVLLFQLLGNLDQKFC